MHPVLLLPEIFIHILSFLPSADLKSCYSVARSWHSILLTNLPARLRPLPDPDTRLTPSLAQAPRTSPAHAPLPLSIRSLAQAIQLYTKQHLLGPSALLTPSDDYFLWQEAAYTDLLHAVLPHLHPLLAKHAYDLTGGISDLAKGEMGIWIRTRMRPNAFEALLDVEENEQGMEYLTQPPTKSVEVRCLDGAVWNTEYGNVQRRGGDAEWQRQCVRVDRERGVRMCDVVNELRGVMKADGRARERGDESVLLEWRMGSYSANSLSWEAFDRTG